MINIVLYARDHERFMDVDQIYGYCKCFMSSDPAFYIIHDILEFESDPYNFSNRIVGLEELYCCNELIQALTEAKAILSITENTPELKKHYTTQQLKEIEVRVKLYQNKTLLRNLYERINLMNSNNYRSTD